MVVRTDGTQGAVTVNYQTVAVNATPGLDFTPDIRDAVVRLGPNDRHDPGSRARRPVGQPR